MATTQVAVSDDVSPENAIAEMERIFKAQRAACERDRHPSAQSRKAALDKLRSVVTRHATALAAEVSHDFGHRSHDETLFAEVVNSIEGIKYARRNVAKWMEPDVRHVSAMHMPAKARVVYQPLGVVGIVVPWNYPIYLAVGPLIAALAAGNRVMIKMSSYTPRLAQKLKEALADAFPEDQVAVITTGGAVSDAFSKLPFDHILFTGSTAVGRTIMENASKNLVPVTLELGGKSPVILHESFPIKDAVPRIAFGKCWNAGQTCVAPDHLLCPESKVDEFVHAFRAQVEKMYPTMLNNADYTSVINAKQYRRIQGYLADARAKGARVIEINPAGERFEDTHKMPVTLVLDVKDDMEIMQNEIFGPVLPIVGYEGLDDAIDYVNARPRPLALYYFDYDRARAQRVEIETCSGGMCINDTISHVGVEDLPFGGVGPAGMGRYHAKEGFITLSNARSVLEKSKVYPLALLLPPFGSLLHKLTKAATLR